MIRGLAAAVSLLLLSGALRAESITVTVHYQDKAPALRVYANGGQVIVKGEDGKDVIIQTVAEKPTPVVPTPAARPKAEPDTMPKITAEQERRQALRALLKVAPRK